jgi:hypothetical protein
MGSFAAQFNKALLPLDDRAILTHIIEKFPAGTEFVIGLGHLREQIPQYLRIAHPDLNVTFVQVDKFEGPGSGPGYSLLCCREHLHRPFYFVACDTLWENALPRPGAANWLGVAPVPIADTIRYCSLRVDSGMVTDVRDKEHVPDQAYQAFVGLCYIYDHAAFWQALEGSDLVDEEHQVSNGLGALIHQSDVRAHSIVWTDVGDVERYRRAVLQYSDYDFSKSDELFFSVESKVIKYFADDRITDLRVAKAALNTEVFPSITDHQGGFYAYTFQPGETLYTRNNPDLFRALLNWLEGELWNHVAVDPSVTARACRSFYHDKTLARLDDFARKYPLDVQPSVVNGRQVLPLETLLLRVPWSWLEEGIPCFMHGDLQFDNILYDEATKAFTLIDWRQDFAGHIAFGDLYYDLAKLRGGVILNYDYIKRNLLAYEEEGASAHFDFAQRYQTETYLDIFDSYVLDRGLDLAKVRLLVALIYLNMAPLHHYPFDKMLHALGRVMLAKELEAQG